MSKQQKEHTVQLSLQSFFKPNQWKTFIRRVNKAAKMQIQEHNVPNAPDSTNAVKAVESYAKFIGLNTIWPGLYPIFLDEQKRQYHIPSFITAEWRN